MAIRSYPWLDGFDYYATDRLTYKWASASNIHVSPTSGRRNSGCITPTGAGYLVSREFESWNTDTEVWEPVSFFSVAFAVFRQTPDAFKVIAESAGSTAEFEFEFTCSGRIGYRKAGGTWYYTDGIIPMGEWCHVFLYIEARQSIAVIQGRDSHGNMLIDDLIDGFALGWTFSADALFATWRIEAAVCGNWRIDDLYIQDALFKEATALGDCRIDALEMINDAPTSEYDLWTISSGTSFFAAVNQVPEYATSLDEGAVFGCTTAGLTHQPDTIPAVQLNAWAKYELADQGFVIYAGSNQSTFITPTTTEDGYSFTWTENATAPWMIDELNITIFGVGQSD